MKSSRGMHSYTLDRSNIIVPTISDSSNSLYNDCGNLKSTCLVLCIILKQPTCWHIWSHLKMTSPQKWHFWTPSLNFFTIFHYFFLALSPISPSKKKQTFLPKSKLWNIFWYLFDASYCKHNHKWFLFSEQTI